ncbi:VOC family protein [bacterium]|nr:VOC family protein [bacterium]
MDFCWVTIHVKDMPESLHFYRDILGLEVHRKMDPGPDMQIVFLGSGKTEIELIYRAESTELNYGKDISLGFVVDSVNQEIKRLEKEGIAVESGPFQPNPHIQFFYILDPNGVRIQFVENVGE